MKKRASNEKVSKSVLCYRIFVEIALNENNTYGKLIESIGISKQTIGEALGYLEEQKIIQKINPPKNIDKRMIQLLVSEAGFRKFYEKWVTQNYSPHQLEQRIKQTGFLEARSDYLMNFFKDWGKQPGMTSFSHFFVLYDYVKAPFGKMRRFIPG